MFRVLFPALFVAALMSAGAAEPPRVAPFLGKFLRSGKATVSNGDGIIGRGRSQVRFTSTSDGGVARLRISGSLRIEGTPRSFTNIILFKKEALAALSNLAPGIDDGHVADEGSYRAGTRSIRVSFPFRVGTTTGSAEIFLRLEKSARVTRIRITQTLVSDALTAPVVWQFSASGRP